jgi:histidinol dehydrogenase
MLLFFHTKILLIYLVLSLYTRFCYNATVIFQLMTKTFENDFIVNPIESTQKREKGVLVYPVYSRRSGGLSVGINMFPDKKLCSFDCPYCEVFPFSTSAVFCREQMENDLRTTISASLKQNITVNDICFSGNGEPTMSLDFPEALERANRVRSELVPSADLVLITNGSGLLDKRLFDLLRDAATGVPALDIWLKLDAGTPEWYQAMSRSGIPFEELMEKIKEFIINTPITIQTMICAFDNRPPPPEESEAWEKLVFELVTAAKQPHCGIRKVQIYGKARPSPEDPKTTALPVKFLEERAMSLRRALAPATVSPVPHSPIVEVYP